MAIFVSGFAGFIGAYLIHHGLGDCGIDTFERSDEAKVRSILNLSKRHWKKGDIRRGVDSKEVDVIIHLAAEQAPPRSNKSPTEILDVNVFGTTSMLEHARRNDARFVFASSMGLYGNTRIVYENTSFNPKNVYTLSKAISEDFCERHAITYGLDVISLRIGIVHGRPVIPIEKDTVVNRFIRQALENKDITVYGDGHQTRGFIHLENLYSIIKQSCKVNLKGYQPFNTFVEQMPISKLAERVASKTKEKGYNPKVVNVVPNPRGQEHQISASNEKLKRTFDFEGISIEKTVEEFMEVNHA